MRVSDLFRLLLVPLLFACPAVQAQSAESAPAPMTQERLHELVAEVGSEVFSDGLIYAAYIHPLSSLSETELRSAIRQVATAQQSFGSTYSSGELFFAGDTGL